MTSVASGLPASQINAHSCWKAADLRGVFPTQVSAELFQRIGAAVATTLPVGSEVMIAGDFRISTPQLKEALRLGLTASGADVIDAGQIPTPVAYFATTQHKPAAVLIVTASHNPADHNGLKLLFGDRPPTPDELIHLREVAGSQQFHRGNGRISTVDPLPAYEDFIVMRWRHLDPSVLPTLVLDAGNGAWSESAPQIFARLGFHLERISCVLDGRFPDRSSDCSRPANLLRLREQVARTDYALGIAWDGDGDRVAIVDEAGQFVSADELSMLFARELLGASRTSRTVSPQVVLDIKLASAVQREVERLGGIPLLERTGHAFLRTRMVAAQAALGLDACGHFFFGELNGADDGVFAALMLLSMIQRTGLSLNELVKQLPQTHGTPELRIPLALLKYEEAEVELLKVFSGWSVDRLDGVRLTAEQGVVLLRRSGTESVLSLRIEGTSRAAYEMLVAKCVDAFPSTRGTIESQLREHLESAPTVSSAENSAAELG